MEIERLKTTQERYETYYTWIKIERCRNRDNSDQSRGYGSDSEILKSNTKVAWLQLTRGQ